MKNSLSRALGGKHPKVIRNRSLKQLKPRLTRRGHMSVHEKVTGNACEQVNDRKTSASEQSSNQKSQRQELEYRC